MPRDARRELKRNKKILRKRAKRIKKINKLKGISSVNNKPVMQTSLEVAIGPKSASEPVVGFNTAAWRPR